MNGQPPLVCILTPVHNGEAYLRECIESVLAQTHINWEYTIVNNSSRDNTLAIAQEYAAKDRRIRVHDNTEFLPIIANHNKAFSLISPEAKYCKVVSADDWIYPECLARMVELAEGNPSIGLIGAYQLSGGDSEWYVRNTGLPHPRMVIPGSEACRLHLLGQLDVFGNPTSSLYRADLVRASKAFYPNETAEADRSACFQTLQVSDYGFIHQVLSYERLHEDRVTTKSRKYMAYTSANINDCIAYGQACLSPDEQETRIQALLDTYYGYLAYSAFRFRDRGFWQYHAVRLKQVGYPLQWGRLSRKVTGNVLNLALNPKLCLEKLWRRLATLQPS